MSIIVVIGVSLFGVLLFGQKEKWWPKMIFGCVALCLIIVSLVGAYGQTETFLKIPFTRIEDLEYVEVSNSGSFVLESSQSSILTNEFVVTDDNGSEMDEWLLDTTKSVTVRISSGSKTLYSKNLGLYRDGMNSDIRTIYTSWKDKGVVPNGTTKYWFFGLYLEV